MNSRQAPSRVHPALRLAARIGLAILLVYAAFVVVINVALSGPLPQLISKEEDITIRLEGAWSFWPGQVFVEKFAMDYEDSSVVLSLRLEDLSTHIELLSLTRLHFAASEIKAEKANIQLWSKEDLTPGSESPKPMPGEWSVAIDVRSVKATSVRIQRYRYAGDITVFGGFTMKPKAELEVRPTAVTFRGGQVFDDGSYWCSSGMCQPTLIGQLDIAVKGSAPKHQLFKGVDVVERLQHTGLKLNGTLKQLPFLSTWIPRISLAGGAGDLLAQIRLHRGHLVSPSELSYELTAPLEWKHTSTARLSYRLPNALLTAAFTPTQHQPQAVAYTFTSNDARINAGASEVGKLQSLQLEGTSEGQALAQLFILRSASIESKLHVRALGKLNAALRKTDTKTDIGGRIDAELNADWTDSSGWKGQLTANSDHLTATLPLSPIATLTMGAQVHLSAKVSDLNFSSYEIADAMLHVKSATVNRAAESTDSWWARVDLPALTYRRSTVQGTFFGKLANADLPLILLGIKSEIPGVVDALISTEELRLTVDVTHSAEQTRIHLKRADSEGVDVHGSYVRTGETASGAFLADVGVATVGLKLQGGDTSVHPFVGENWLSENTPDSDTKKLSTGR